MTPDESVVAVNEICRIGLYGSDFMRSLKPEQIASACNGCGPESWPEAWRAHLDRWLSTFRLAFDIHDCRFTFDNDGSRVKFDAANDELEKNCLVLADEKFAWYNPFRYFARNRAHIIADACRSTFGWKAFREAHEKGTR